MTVRLEPPPDVESGLLEQAETHGLPLEEYLVEHVLREALRKQQPPSRRKNLVELFAESRLKGLDLEFERNQDSGRPISL